jgi:quercetin 2,3-dioxygenase
MSGTKIDGAAPAVEVRTSDSRHRTDIGWLHGRHSFDTGIDPYGSDTHHGLLVVNNHDTIEPGTGFDTHPHRNLEIVTWVIGGSLVHQDSEDHSGVIYPDLAQRMSAGRGIWHSERNDRAGTDEPVELVQMWVVPDETETTPGYEQLNLSPSHLDGKLAVIASGMPGHGDETAIHIRNRRAALHVARLDGGQSVEVPDAPFVHLYLPRGEVVLEGAGTLQAGDAVRLTGAGPRRVSALVPSEVLVWEMHTSLTSRR